jgi:hypothetical protein
MSKKKVARRKKEEGLNNAVEALAALDAEYRARRQKYSIFVEGIQRFGPLDKAEAWLSYVSENIDCFGDQEALVYLVSRQKDCSRQINGLIARWKESEKRAIATCVEGISVCSLETGKTKTYKIRSVAEASRIETLSPFELQDFWYGSRVQEASIDATMLRTVEWCGIGGFEPWWRRFAKEHTRNLSLGGLEPLPLSFWLFNMCRSGYAISLMPKALAKALDALEVSDYGQTHPWTFRREYDPPGDPPVDHIPFACSIVFGNAILRHGEAASELVSPAIGALQKHQNEHGAWPCWATDGKPSVEATAMAMHAIALKRPAGSERVLAAGQEFLLAHQDRGGHWMDPASPDAVYLTVLVLDAIELANGGSTLTFHLPGSPKNSFGHGRGQSKPVQKQRRFCVALSFPGEYRSFVEAVAETVAQAVGKERVFYDKYYEAELARPNLDVYLQSIYHNDSEVLVVFLCAGYEQKEWCRLEWRAIRDLIKKHRQDDVMLFRFDKTEIPGVLSIDGYIDAAECDPQEVARLILQRATN